MTEWMVYDRDKDKIKTTLADNQRHAIKKIHSLYGITPKRTDHTRPRTGDGELMGRHEFQKFMRD